MLSTPSIVYVVFDRFPAPKGAAIHIAAFARALSEGVGPVELITLADDPASLQPNPSALPDLPNVIHTPLPAPGQTVIDRAMAFRSHFAAWRRGRKFPIVHFRSVFEGYPIVRHKSQVCEKLVFEVNGLPSIELKYHYPAVADDRDLLEKLFAQEQACIEAADLIVTVSEVTAKYLISRGADASRIQVIPNGVDLSIFHYRAPRRLLAGIGSLFPVLGGEGWGEGPGARVRDARQLPESPLTPTLSPGYMGEGEMPFPNSPNGARNSALPRREGEMPSPNSALCTLHSALPSNPALSTQNPPLPLRLLYSGTLASWQGADRAVEAVALLRRDLPATLTLIGPASRARKEDLLRLADSLAVAPFVRLLDPLPQHGLAALHHEHDIALAPLLRNDRNVVQGCCPLKVLEAMASGTPLIASDLPVVRALAENEAEALLVKPGSAKAIKDAAIRLATEPNLATRLSAAARRKVEECFTWEIAGRKLVRAYPSPLTPSA